PSHATARGWRLGPARGAQWRRAPKWSPVSATPQTRPTGGGRAWARAPRAPAAADPPYGWSTGFGSLATVPIPLERREELQRALLRSHAAGMGSAVEREVVRAMLLLRAGTLAMGRWGARPAVAEAMLALLNAGLTPVVPEHGSLGASG